MIIEQFEDYHLAHFSYAILSECERKVIVIDPARNPEPYYAFAHRHHAAIVAVIETHPHADFASSHLEIHRHTGATIYVSHLARAGYPHTGFDKGIALYFGKVTLKALNTPGHSPDSICILLEHSGHAKAIFTGDTLFIGDCGRPDLREKAGRQVASREELARQMYHSLRDIILPLPDEVTVYPAHGAGSLCGKALGDHKSSTIGIERRTNWALQPLPEEVFVKELLKDQPFIPRYFPFDVELNLEGAKDLGASLHKVPVVSQPASLDRGIVVVDARTEGCFKEDHLPNSINLMNGNKFETWLGSLVNPHEPFYLTAGDEPALESLVKRAAAIGYESFIKAAFVFEQGGETSAAVDVADFRESPEEYTIVDVRNDAEVKVRRVFADSIHIPLASLREAVYSIPLGKPVMVHCAGGYRSAVGSSLLEALMGDRVVVYDLGDAVKSF